MLRHVPSCAVLGALLLLAGCGDFADGVAAYQAGRYPNAHAAFAAAERRAGDAADAVVLYDRALAALRAGKLRDAEWSIEKAVVRGGVGIDGVREFVHGNTAFARCRRAEAELTLTDPEPTAFDRAIGHAEAARDAWIRATEIAGDWPAARRNVERALLELADLRKQRDEAQQRQRARQEKQAVPSPKPERPEDQPREPGQETERPPAPQGDPDALNAQQIEALLARLAETEQEKRAVRRAERASRSADVERDW